MIERHVRKTFFVLEFNQFVEQQVSIIMTQLLAEPNVSFRTRFISLSDIVGFFLNLILNSNIPHIIIPEGGHHL